MNKKLIKKCDTEKEQSVEKGLTDRIRRDVATSYWTGRRVNVHSETKMKSFAKKRKKKGKTTVYAIRSPRAIKVNRSLSTTDL